MKFGTWVALIGLFAGVISYAQTDGKIVIDTTKKVTSVSPNLYGLMTEEINYSYDGGIYAEMVANRTLRKGWDGYQHWSYVTRGDSKMTIEHVKDGPSTALPSSIALHITSASAGNEAGLANEGYWGMAVRPLTVYQGSFYAKGIAGDARVALVSNETGSVVAHADVPISGAAWRQYHFSMKTDGDFAPSDGNHLEITFAQPANVQLQLVSLFPPTYHDRPNGNRPDLMKMLTEMKPHFLRLPGGNYLEGDHIKERFNWKETIGPLVDRPTHQGPWNYQSMDGMGLLEFLEWCEDLNIEPLLAVYAGYSLTGEQVTGKDLDPYIQDTLDEIEYVTGDTSTMWGAVRARDGHPTPFPLHYVEIGNEDGLGKGKKSYDERFSRIAEAIRSKYPGRFKLIATTPVAKGSPDLIDDHYYLSPDEFFAMDKKYDAYDRKGPKIFIGEWATRTGSPTPNFGAALGDAAWMTSMERNSDLIEMASYAPLFTNVNPGAMQWPTDLIGYTADKAYGSPSYWAQVLFAQHLGDHTVESKAEGVSSRFFWSATVTTQKKLLHLKLVNASDMPQGLTLDIKGAKAGAVAVLSLHAPTRFATNTIDRPHQIEPVTTKMPLAKEATKHVVPANTIEVLDIPLF